MKFVNYIVCKNIIFMLKYSLEVFMKNFKVCEIVNGKPFVSQIVTEDVIELILRYSLFRKEIKRYDKHTLREIE